MNMCYANFHCMGVGFSNDLVKDQYICEQYNNTAVVHCDYIRSPYVNYFGVINGTSGNEREFISL